MMGDFDIEHVKLQNGNHQYTYELDGTFFELFKNDQVLNADLKTEANVDKTASMAVVDISTKGRIGLQCDRCLESLDYPVETSFKVIYHLNSEFSKVNEAEEVGLDIVYLTANDFKFNIAKSIYESFLPALPMVKNCDDLKEKPCNQDILTHLEHSNKSEKTNKQETTDPRWDDLKKLLNKK